MQKNRFSALSLIAAVAWGAVMGLSPAHAADNATQALQTFNAKGYSAVYDLELRHGLWTAEATSTTGARVDLLLDAQGQVIEVGPETVGALPGYSQVLERLNSLGYRQVHDVERDDGFWTADALNSAGHDVDVVLHPVTLEVLSDGTQPAVLVDATGTGQTALSAQSVYAALEQAGYRNVHDLDLDEDDGYWEAEAINASGQRVELRINPYTGAVLRERLDD